MTNGREPQAPARTGRTKRRLLFNASSLAVGGLLAQACMVLVEAVIARRLGQVDYGVFSTAYAFGLIGMFVIEAGMGWKLIQDGSRDDRSMPSLLGTTLVLRTLLAIIVFPLMIAGFHLLAPGPGMSAFFAVLFAYVFLMTVQSAFGAVYSARQSMHVNAMFQAATPILILVLVWTAATGDLTLRSVAISYVAGSLVVSGIWAWTTFRLVRPVVQIRRGWQILRESYLYAITGLLLHFSLRLELFMLSIFRPMAEVGLFAAADKLTDLGLKVAVMGSRVVAPVLFEQSHRESEIFRHSCRRVMRASAVLGVAAALALSLTATWIVPLIFGPQFAMAGTILSILAVSLGLRFMAQAAQIVLTANDRHLRRTVAQASGVGAAGAANLALIPGFGTLGAACGRLAGDLVQMTLLLTSRGLPVGRLQALMWLLVPSLIGGALYWALAQVEIAPVLELAAGLVLYALLLLLTGSVRIRELRELARMT
ncbi:MAG: oligosaccharide flippase family protein [Steroidobacteraceae bacterium]